MIKLMRKLHLVLAISMILASIVYFPAFAQDNDLNSVNSYENELKIESKTGENKDVIIEKLNGKELKNLEDDSEIENDILGPAADNSKNIKNKYRSISVKINTLNYFDPIEFKSVKDNQYSINLFEKLYDYGKVRLLIVPDNNSDANLELKKEITFDKVLSEGNDYIIELDRDKEYLYNIFITNEDNVTSSHYGKISMKNKKPECSVEYISDEETIQKESTFAEPTIGTQAIVYTNSIYESEANNTTSSADTIYSGRDVYGRIGSSTDVDYYKVTFGSAGTANFWLGDMYTNCDYDLYVYNSSGTVLWSSTNANQSQELISNKSVSNTSYYVKVVSYGSNYNYEYYYFLRVKLTTDSSTALAWPTIETTINACYHCPSYLTNYGFVHGGVDIAGTNANPIVAIASGKVSTAGWVNGYGNVVYVNHDMVNPNTTGSSDRYIQTRYAHMIEILVSLNEQVSRGKILGYIGNTGPSDGEHLHFETRVGSSFTSLVTTDPLEYYPGTKYCTYCDTSMSSISPELVTYSENIDVTSNDNDVRDVIGIYINNDYFLDLECLSEMSFDELEKYGVTDKVLDKFAETIKSEEDLNIYLDDIYKKRDLIK